MAGTLLSHVELYFGSPKMIYDEGEEAMDIGGKVTGINIDFDRDIVEIDLEDKRTITFLNVQAYGYLNP